MKIKKGMNWGSLCGNDIETLYNQALPINQCNGEEFTPGECLICFYDTDLVIAGKVDNDLDIFIELDAKFQ